MSLRGEFLSDEAIPTLEKITALEEIASFAEVRLTRNDMLHAIYQLASGADKSTVGRNLGGLRTCVACSKAKTPA